MIDNGGPLLRLDAVNTYYGPIHILQGLSLAVYPGELVCLLGGNASGKSTTSVSSGEAATPSPSRSSK